VSGPNFTPRRGITGTPYMRTPLSPYDHSFVWSKDVLADIAQSEKELTGMFSGPREPDPAVLEQYYRNEYLASGDRSYLIEMEKYVSADAPVLSRAKKNGNLLDKQLSEIPQLVWNSLGRYKPFTTDEDGVTFRLWPCAFWLVLFAILISII